VPLTAQLDADFATIRASLLFRALRHLSRRRAWLSWKPAGCGYFPSFGQADMVREV
jgi:hypothetical protein